jgi:hypothetical protein
MSRENQEDCGFLKLPTRHVTLIPDINLEIDVTDLDLLDQSSIPSSVREKLWTFRDIAAERHAALRGTSDEMRTASDRLARVGADLKQLVAEAELKKDHPSVVQLQKESEREAASLARLRERIERMDPDRQMASRLAAQLERYVRMHIRGTIVLHEGDMPQLKDGEKAIDGHERAARRTRTLKADRSETLSAPFPSAVAKKIAREQIAARIEAAKPDVTMVIDRCEAIKFPNKVALTEHISGSSMADVYVVDPVGLLGWLFPNDFQAAIDREIDASAEDEIALSAEERIARLAQIDGDLLASEREEAAFAELAGLLPRDDIDPRAALGLADSMPAPERN